MTTRATTNGYKVTLDYDSGYFDFEEFFGDFIDLCIKDVSRDYKLPNTLKLEDRKIDYLTGNKDKKTIMEEDYYVEEEDFEELDKMKKDKKIVWVTFFDYGGGCICIKDITRYWDYSGCLILDKECSNENDIIKSINAWLKWEIFWISIYEKVNYKPEWENALNEKPLIYWNYVDGCGGYTSTEEALDSLPDYVWKIIENTETEKFDAFEFVY